MRIVYFYFCVKYENVVLFSRDQILILETYTPLMNADIQAR